MPSTIVAAQRPFHKRGNIYRNWSEKAIRLVWITLCLDIYIPDFPPELYGPLETMTIMNFLKNLYREIEKDNVFNGAAALAYYWILAIFPAAIFLLSLLPFLPVPNLQQSLTDFTMQALPGQASQLLTGINSGQRRPAFTP
jgi:hypothetical protein